MAVRMMLSEQWRSRFNALLITAPLSIAAMIATSCPAIAQISIFPVVIELTADENGESQAFIEVSNQTDELFEASITPKPFTYSRTGGFTTTSDRTSDLSPYLQFYPSELSVPPGTSRTIRVITSFPDDLPQREYRLSLITAELNRRLTPNNNQAPVNHRVAITIYARNGELQPYLQVMGARWNKFNESVELSVKNAGQASARPVVNWGIYRGNQEFMVGSTVPMAVITGTERNLVLNDARLGSLGRGYYQIKGDLVLDAQGGEDSLVQPFSQTIKIP
jgi:hypothetical protein